MRQTRFLFLGSLLAICASQLAAESTGRMCIAAVDEPFESKAECFATISSARIAVRPATKRRRFVWTSPARQDLVLGLILPGDEAIVFAETRRGAMQIDLTGSPQREWPVATTIDLTERDLGRWTFTLDEKQVVNPVTLHLPHGVYDIVATAAGHRVMKHDGLTIADGGGKARVNIALAPMMRVTASVVASGEAVPWAKVFADCERQLCESDVNGRIRCDVPAPVPRMLCIEQPRFGRRRILIDSSRVGVDLGAIELKRGATLLVERPPHIALPAGTVTTLLRVLPNSRPTEVATRPIDDDQPFAIFEDLDAGDYKLLLKGPEPLQRSAIDVAIVAESEKRLPIAFDAYQLNAQVRFDDQPFAHADVELMESLWKARLKTDEGGRFQAQLWSPAEFGVLVSGGSLREPFGTMMRAAMNDSEWTINVPNRKIVGRIVDANSGEGVRKARLRVESDDGNVHSSRVAFADDDGRYEISAVPVAKFRITAQAPDYLVPEATELELTREERERRLDFPLVRGERMTLVVRDAAGRPLPDALLAETATGDPTSIARLLHSGDDGTVSTMVMRKSISIMYVMPREGSLTIAPLVAHDDGTPLEIRVADPSGTLRVRAENISGEPVGGVAVALRMNGQSIPYAVLRQFAILQGGNTVTMLNGEVVLPKLPAAMYALCLGTANRCALPSATWVDVPLNGDTRVSVRLQ